MATNDDPTGQGCPRCAAAVLAAAKARLTADDARWHSVLADIINGDVRVGPDPNGPGILLTTPTGTAGLASLAHLVRDLQQPAQPKPAPLFGTSEVPETVTVTVPLGLSALNPALADGRIEVVLNFLSDSELAPKVDNPSVTVRGYGVQPGKPTVATDWREAEAVDDWDEATSTVVDDITGDAARTALLALADQLWLHPESAILQPGACRLETPKGVISVSFIGKLISRAVQA